MRPRAQNHDTGSTLNHWPFPWNHLHEGYAYILTHPGTPTVFCDHYFADGLGESIRELVKIRKRVGLHCRSKARPRPMAPRRKRSSGVLLRHLQRTGVHSTFARMQGSWRASLWGLPGKASSALGTAQLAAPPDASFCVRCGLG